MDLRQVPRPLLLQHCCNIVVTEGMICYHGNLFLGKGLAMRSSLRKMGNSSAIIVPKLFLAEIGAEAGDDVDMHVEAGRIVISRLSAHPRSAWAQDAKALASADDDALAWPEFGNADDAALTW